MMTDVPTFNMVDLFSGVGGFTIGFTDVSDYPGYRFRSRLMVDTDREARDVASRNLHVPFLSADVAQLSAAEVRKAAKMGEKEVLHLLVGGPPCQGVSRLGKRALEDPRNVLMLDFLRMVKELRPLVAVIENVPLVFTSHGGAIINEISESLSGMGYSNIADILLASDYGVPQLRRRAMVIAYRSDIGMVPRLPTRTHERIGYASKLMTDGDRIRFEPEKLPYVSVADAIGDLPSLHPGQGEEVAMYKTPPTTDYQRWVRAGSIALFNHRSRTHTAEFLKKLSVIAEGGRNFDLPDEQRFSDNYYSQAYARLHRNGISQTITTYFSNPGSGRFIHYEDLRSITVREAARLQSFSDVFAFDGTLATQMRHVGNAVPPLMARALRSVIGEDLVVANAHLETRPVGRPRALKQEDPAQRSRIMAAVPSKNTSAELTLRKALTSIGLRGYRLHRKDLPGSPDIVFARHRLAVFVDGCFWHGCPECYRAPRSRSEYWKLKVERNRKRDERVNQMLEQDEWTVLRIWEHNVLKSADKAARLIGKAIKRRRSVK